MEEKKQAQEHASLRTESPGVRKKPVLNHHLSSFGVLNRNGLEIPSGIGDEPATEQADAVPAEFTAWSMPEQRPGFIQAKKHDFF